MRSHAKCGSCASRKPLSDFPVAVVKPPTRVTALCIQCLDSADKDWTLDPDYTHIRLPEAGEGTDDGDADQAATAQCSMQDAEVTSPGIEVIGADEFAMMQSSSSHRTRGQRQLRPRPPGAQLTPLPPRKKIRIATHFTCRICCEEKLVAEFPKSVTKSRAKSRGRRKRNLKTIPDSCQSHVGRRGKGGPVCHECIGRSMMATLDDRGAERVGCFECGLGWSGEYVAFYLEGRELTRYSEGILREVVLTTSNFIWCPMQGCSSGGFSDKNEAHYPQVECFECKSRICAECNAPWHKGQTCQQYRLTSASSMSEEELNSLKSLVEAGAKRCPKCAMAIIKNMGCNHMHCLHCRAHFDWGRAEDVETPDTIKDAGKAVFISNHPSEANLEQTPNLLHVGGPGSQPLKACEADANPVTVTKDSPVSDRPTVVVGQHE